METKQGSYTEINWGVLTEINSCFLSHISICFLLTIVCRHTQLIFWKGIFYTFSFSPGFQGTDAIEKWLKST